MKSCNKVFLPRKINVSDDKETFIAKLPFILTAIACNTTIWKRHGKNIALEITD